MEKYPLHFNTENISFDYFDERKKQIKNVSRYGSNNIFLCCGFCYDVDTVLLKVHPVPEKRNEDDGKNW